MEHVYSYGYLTYAQAEAAMYDDISGGLLDENWVYVKAYWVWTKSAKGRLGQARRYAICEMG